MVNENIWKCDTQFCLMSLYPKEGICIRQGLAWLGEQSGILSMWLVTLFCAVAKVFTLACLQQLSLFDCSIVPSLFHIHGVHYIVVLPSLQCFVPLSISQVAASREVFDL